MKKKIFDLLFLSFLGVCCLLSYGCKKQNDWLEEKSLKSKVVPTTLKDYQAILDNTGVMNKMTLTGLVGTDNVYINSDDVGGLFESEKNLYLWNKSVWSGGVSFEWQSYYKTIEYSNIVIDGLANLDKSQPGYNNALGQAYFFRAAAYYHLAQLFCKPYNEATANADPGLPVRTTSDVNVIIKVRSSVQQVYDQIISDIEMATSLLNESQLYLQRPSKLAATALLLKVYFVQEQYSKALDLADQVLKKQPGLVDYNNSGQVSQGNAYGFLPNGVNNPEIIFYAEANGYISAQNYLGSAGFVPEDLYNSYEENDLRKLIYFVRNNNGYNYLSSYTGNFYPFGGIATNEIYFIRAECNARAGAVAAALSDLNLVLKSRYKTGTLTPKNATTPEDAMHLILNEKRKELPMVAEIRWEDLRRLNKDSRFQTTLTRTVYGILYNLPPNDSRYVLPIPDQEIQYSGVEQNVR